MVTATPPPVTQPAPHSAVDRAAGEPGASALPARALHVWNATTAVVALPVAAAAAVGAVLWRDTVGSAVLWGVVALAVLLAVLDVAVINRLRHRSYSYTVDENEVYVSKGVLVQHTVDVAVPQVLSVHITRGPVQRALGLASVRFVSVVEGESLGPVETAEAERISRVVLRGLERRRAESAALLGRTPGGDA